MKPAVCDVVFSV